jgi:glycosyltransferase involved in cell wall biosynthesis
MSEPARLLPLYQQVWTEDTRPVVSVFCFAYNHGRMIIDCLDGMLRQVTDFRVEILVHDDASTDGTTRILQHYARRFPQIVRLVLQKQNQFALNRKHRNLLTPMARGEFIASCDGDDVWLDPEKLAKQVRFLRAHPDFMLSYHNAFRGTDPRTKIGELEFPRPMQVDYTREQMQMGEVPWLLMGAVMYRNVISAFPPEYDLSPNGDNFLPLLLGAWGHAKYQRDITPMFYRQHSHSMWSSRPPEEQARMHAQTTLQMCAYLVRTGQAKAAERMAREKLPARLQIYFRHTLLSA